MCSLTQISGGRMGRRPLWEQLLLLIRVLLRKSPKTLLFSCGDHTFLRESFYLPTTFSIIHHDDFATTITMVHLGRNLPASTILWSGQTEELSWIEKTSD